jgi:hypothetical protein
MHSRCVSDMLKYAIGIPNLPIATEIDNCRICLNAKPHEANNLTVPVKVTDFNVSELSALVANGPTQHPGAKQIIRSDGTRIDLRYVKNKSELLLSHGWIVERHLRDDDVLLFNRQPSLHKMSIMGHRAKVLDWSTFAYRHRDRQLSDLPQRQASRSQQLHLYTR